MNITRNNYEEYFILYMDNELSSEDRRLVELFVKENPDLQGELNLLMQTQLAPDNSFTFISKEQLYKTAGNIPIDTNNYEEWLLSYTDNELSAEQKIAVEKFVVDHPVAKANLEILQKIKFEPDQASVFPDKETLYRREEKVRIIAIQWRRIAVAIALLLALGATSVIIFNDKKHKTDEIASGEVEQKKPIKENPVIKKQDYQTTSANPKITDEANTNIEKEIIETNNPIAKEDKRVDQKQKTTPYSSDKIKQDEPVVADNIEKKKTNDLPQPTYNPYVNRNAEQDNPIAKIDVVKDPLTNIKESNSIPTVTPNSSQPLNNVITAASKVSVDPDDEERPGRKNKLRGFFRKVTRTFEKNTNIKATDEEDRLLLGGLAIKL